MAGSDKTVYQVVRRLNGGVTVLGEVRDSEVSPVRIRETRDPRITLGRIGSFWLVVGEKKEPKLILEATDPSARRTWRPPQMFANISANASFELPETVEEFSDPGRHEARSFTSATQLSVGFSPRDNDFEGIVRQLRSGTLVIPSDVDVTAIEVRAGGWVTTGIKRLKSGHFGFAPGVSIRSVAICSSSTRLDIVRLSDGRVVFVTQPHWSFGEATDLRTPDEIVDAAEKWLIRARSALGSTPGSEDDLAEGLRKHLAHTVEADEKADLVASIRLLATRESLQEILPQMMAREPLLQERLKEYELSEKERIRAAARSTVELELESERKRLTAIREDIIEAESRLSVATHRESLLRIESDRHDENIRSKVADAARQVGAMSTEHMEQLRSEVEQLKTLINDLTSSTPQPLIHEQSNSTVPDINAVDDIPQPPVTTAATFELSTVEGRGGIIMAVRKACGLSAGEVAAVIAYSTDGVPVFVGQKASGVTVDIVTALGGENAAVAFCDPTRISWQDLLQDKTSGLATSVAFAKAHPEILVPIAICNITHGPSEFWIPQFIEARRIGRIPRNLAVFASAGIDGMRVSMSDSALRHLLPVLVPDGAKTVRSLFAGAWPLEVDLDRKRLAEARDWLSERAGLEGAELDRGSRTLSRIHPSIAMSEASHPFERQAQWQRALAADGKHEFNQYFKNIEG